MTFDAQTLATFLLILRLVATGLSVSVIIRQIHNIRTLHTDYPVVRWTILILTVVLLVGQFVPIILDTVVSFGNLYPGRNPQPNILATSYSLNNALKDVIIGALLVFLHYRPGSNRR